MGSTSWIALYPEWYVEERKRLAQHHPVFRVDETRIEAGEFRLYGDILVRSHEGTQRYPVELQYPTATPYEKPIVVPLESLPEWDDRGAVKTGPQPKIYSHRHQMPDGALCLFQRETRANPGGDIVTGVDALQRAIRWFLGMHTGHWPPDSAESELEAHFWWVTDVLVGDALYSDRLEGGYGRFFFTRDYRRLIDAPDEDNYPMIVTSLTIETGGIIQPVDTRLDLARVYPWIRGDAWGTTNAILSETRNVTQFDPVEQGYWWSLPVEPQPFKDGAGLLRELQCALPNRNAWEVMSAALGPRMTTQPRHCIAFRYPGRHDTIEWLMVVVAPGIQAGGGGFFIELEPDKRRRFEAAPVGGIRVHSIRPTELGLRNTGVVTPGVAGKTVALVGLGALGSEVAELLAKAGIGTFRLCDGDRLSIGNVARHVGGVTDFGAAKARVVASRLSQINPHLPFVAEDLEPWSATGKPDRLVAMIAAADLVIATTADEGVESYINLQAILQQKPVVYGRALRRASMGRVFLVRPGSDACKACLATYASEGRAGEVVPTDWIDVPEPADDVILHECGRPVIAGSGIDLAFVAALTARVALTVLEGKGAANNHWLWAKDAAAEIDPRLDQPLSTLTVRLGPQPDCPICAEAEIDRLVLAEGVRAHIVSVVESSPDAETGGILIGYVNDRRQAVVLRATGPGPKAERSRSIFRRDIAYVQAELDQAAAELGNRGNYLGEWHSHLVGDPRPSPTDIASLVGIAGAPNYLTRCPVMIVAGFDRADERCTGLFAWEFPRGRRMYDVPIESAGAAAGGAGNE